MSASVSLQDVILAALLADMGVQALVGNRIYDRAPSDPGLVYPHVTFGPSDYVPDDADCITGRIEDVQLDIWSRDQGRKWKCKAIVDAVKAALHDHEADMGDHALVSMRVMLCRVLDDPDGSTVHGVVQVEAVIDEG